MSMKRLMVWMWMTVVLIGYRILVISLGRRMCRWAEEDGYKNCFMYALHRLYTQDGFVIISPSPTCGWHYHYHWTADLKHFFSYEPTIETEMRWHLAHKHTGILPLTFAGNVKEWDTCDIPDRFLHTPSLIVDELFT